jgi:hypothetical protein
MHRESEKGRQREENVRDIRKERQRGKRSREE